MAIPVEIETILNTALADKPDALSFVKGLDAKAEKLTPEVEAALPKLGELAKLPELQTQAATLTKILGDLKAKDADALVRDFNNLKSVNADLIKQRNEGGKGGTVDVTQTPEYKALEEKLNTLSTDFGTKLKALEDESKASKESAAAADAAKRETDLKSAIISAAAKHKIRNAEDEFMLLKAKGLVGYQEKDGKQVPFFHKLNEKGEKVAVASADELLAHIAATDKTKVDASGKGGAGAEHKGVGGAGGEGPKTAAEANRAFMNKS